MNAAQRRIATRATATALPLGTRVVTPAGTQAEVIGHKPGRALVKYRNARRAEFPAQSLALAA